MKIKFRVLILAILFGAVFIVPQSSMALEPWEAWTEVSNETFTSAMNGATDLTSYNGNLYATGYSNVVSVWEYDGSSSWSQVNTDDFGDTNNDYSYNTQIMEVYNGSLYVGTRNSTTGAEVWAYDGTTWTQANEDGFGANINSEVASLKVYNGNLYAGTYNGEGGGNLFRYDGGTTWAQIGTSGFGDANNLSVGSLEEYDGKLFVGFLNTSTGLQIWSWDGSNFTHVTEGITGFGNPNMEINAMEVYNGNLYVSPGDWGGGASQIYRYDGGTTWKMVNDWGFGDTNNRGIFEMLSYDGKLYATVEYYNGLAGIGVWEYDGITWRKVSLDGFGDSQVYGLALAEHDGKIYASTGAAGEGPANARVWESQPDPTLYPAVDLIGQVDESGDPIWNQSEPNNGQGYNSDEGVVVDNVGIQVYTSYLGNGLDIDYINHRLFYVDRGNSRVLIYNLDENNELVDRYADNVLGQADFSEYLQNRGAISPSANTLAAPRAVSYDSDREWLFVSDENNNRVLVYDVASITNGEDAIHVLGQTDFVSGDFNDLDSIYGIEYDQENQRLFTHPYGSGYIYIYDVASITNGESYVNHLGTGEPGLSANQIGNSECFFYYDSGEDRLFITDQSNDRVVIYDFSGGIIDEMDASYVLGANSLTDLPSGLARNGFIDPRGVFLDSETGTLFVTDHSNGERVLMFDISEGIANGMDAYNVLGQADFDSGIQDASQSTFNDPHGMVYEKGNNKLYVVDEENNRIMIFQFPNITTTPPNGQVGTAYSKNLSAEGGSNHTFSLASGSTLPNGLTLSSSGKISGTPTTAGTYTFTVIAENDYTVAPSTTGLKGGTEMTITIVEAGAVVPPVEEDGIDKDSKKYKKYKEYKEKYSNDSYKQDYKKVKYHKKHNYFSVYWPMKLNYLKYRKISNEEMRNLKINNPEIHQMYKEYYRYRKYKKYREYKKDVF